MAVVQAVFLFGSEMWVLTPQLDKSLKGFHLLSVRRMVGMGPKHQRCGICVYTPIGEALATMGLKKIRVYISCCYNTVVQYITARPIMDLCMAEERKRVQ